MLILKILKKGLYIEIPGTLPTRTPAEIDISKCNLSVVDAYLRQSGIKNYQILSAVTDEEHTPQLPSMEDSSINQRVINRRFSNLENIVGKLLEKQKDAKKTNSEQITNKLNNLEELTKKILEKDLDVTEKKSQISARHPMLKIGKIIDEPQIEELDDKFIPNIDVSNMKMKGKSKKTIKQDKMDIDDNVDLLSRIMGQED